MTRQIAAAELRRLWADHTIMVKDIAHRLGVQPRTLSKRAHALGLPSRKAICARKGINSARMKWPDDQFRAAWLDMTIRTIDMAAEMKCSRTALQQRAARLGLPKRTGNHEQEKRCSDAQFIEVYNSGLSFIDMATVLGYATRQAVQTRRNALGLPRRRTVPAAISLAEYRDRKMAAALARSAEVTRAAMRDAEMVDRLANQRGFS